jgi:hypothetical protein
MGMEITGFGHDLGSKIENAVAHRLDMWSIDEHTRPITANSLETQTISMLGLEP